MEESVTYQAIIRRGEKKGREQGLREEALRMLLLAAQPKLGAPGKPIRAALDAITDVTRFERLAARITTASSWSELLKSN